MSGNRRRQKKTKHLFLAHCQFELAYFPPMHIICLELELLITRDTTYEIHVLSCYIFVSHDQTVKVENLKERPNAKLCKPVYGKKWSV
jgi:hypothetical protein